MEVADPALLAALLATDPRAPCQTEALRYLGPRACLQVGTDSCGSTLAALGCDVDAFLVAIESGDGGALALAAALQGFPCVPDSPDAAARAARTLLRDLGGEEALRGIRGLLKRLPPGDSEYWGVTLLAMHEFVDPGLLSSVDLLLQEVPDTEPHFVLFLTMYLERLCRSTGSDFDPALSEAADRILRGWVDRVLIEVEARAQVGQDRLNILLAAFCRIPKERPDPEMERRLLGLLRHADLEVRSHAEQPAIFMLTDRVGADRDRVADALADLILDDIARPHALTILKSFDPGWRQRVEGLISSGLVPPAVETSLRRQLAADGR